MSKPLAWATFIFGLLGTIANITWLVTAIINGGRWIDTSLATSDDVAIEILVFSIFFMMSVFMDVVGIKFLNKVYRTND